jgi:hypothetical protein
MTGVAAGRVGNLRPVAANAGKGDLWGLSFELHASEASPAPTLQSGSSACFGSGSQKVATKPTRYTAKPTAAATIATFLGA